MNHAEHETSSKHKTTAQYQSIKRNLTTEPLILCRTTPVIRTEKKQRLHTLLNEKKLDLWFNQ